MVDLSRISDKTMCKFCIHVRSGGSGLFTSKTRRRLLTQPHASGHSRSMFWWRIRDQVQNALKDLEMFVALAEKHDVDKVMTKKTLEPIVNVLLYHTFPEPNQQRALIAELFVNTGLEYLKKNSDVGTLSNERTINEAINLAEYLVSHLKEEVEEEEEDSVEI